MTIQVDKDDYIIVRYRGKSVLCFVLNGKSCRAVLEKTLHLDEPENITYENENVQCNLGPNPQNGKIYGIDINPYRNTIETKTFGPIHIFRDVPKKELSELRKAMKSVYQKFEKEASTAFLPLWQIHILPKKGKYAGAYYAKSKGSEVWDQIKLHPDTFSDPLYNEYLIAHEFAHGLWYRCVPINIRAKWMNLYQKRRKLSSIGQKDLDGLYKDLMRYEGSIRDYSKEVSDDEEKLVIKEVMNYFKRYQSMSQDDVEMMINHDSSKLADMWPTRALLSETRPDISTYAMTKVEEFFAEAVAYHFTGRTLPKDVQKGLDITFKKCRQL